MATAAQLAANTANAQSSTGPTTEQGKSASAQNALSTGLFAAGALIRPGEEPFYADLEQSLQTELCPATLMEENLAEEILGAMWRLRRCRLIESTLAALDDDTADRRQTSIDRARAQASRLFYKRPLNSAASRPTASRATRSSPTDSTSPISASPTQKRSSAPPNALRTANAVSSGKA